MLRPSVLECTLLATGIFFRSKGKHVLHVSCIRCLEAMGGKVKDTWGQGGQDRSLCGVSNSSLALLDSVYQFREGMKKREKEMHNLDQKNINLTSFVLVTKTKSEAFLANTVVYIKYT